MSRRAMGFEPIAIVGQSCTLPGALTPQALWANVLAGNSSIASVPAGRWGVPHDRIMGTVAQSADRTWSDKGGYISGFQFDATGTAVPAEQLACAGPPVSTHLAGRARRFAQRRVRGATARHGAGAGQPVVSLCGDGAVCAKCVAGAAAPATRAQPVQLRPARAPHGACAGPGRRCVCAGRCLRLVALRHQTGL
jgi:hypothetical protein